MKIKIAGLRFYLQLDRAYTKMFGIDFHRKLGFLAWIGPLVFQLGWYRSKIS